MIRGGDCDGRNGAIMDTVKIIGSPTLHLETELFTYLSNIVFTWPLLSLLALSKCLLVAFQTALLNHLDPIGAKGIWIAPPTCAIPIIYVCNSRKIILY